MKKRRGKWTRAKSVTGSNKTQKTSLDFDSFLGFRAKGSRQEFCAGETEKKSKIKAVESYLFLHTWRAEGKNLKVFSRAVKRHWELQLWLSRMYENFYAASLLQMEISTSRKLLVTLPCHFCQSHTFCFNLESRWKFVLDIKSLEWHFALWCIFSAIVLTLNW